MDETIPHKTQRAVTAERAVKRLGGVMTQAIRDGVMTCGSIVVADRQDYMIDAQWGWQDPEAKTALEDHTLFDLASVTKLFTVTAFLRQVQTDPQIRPSGDCNWHFGRKYSTGLA